MHLLLYTLGLDFDFPLYQKIIQRLSDSGHVAHVLTNSLYDFYKIKEQGLPVFLLQKAKQKHQSDGFSELLLLKTAEMDAIERVYSATVETVSRLHAKYRYDAFLAWNGHNAVCLGLKDVAKAQGVQTLFLELANIDGKVFSDPQGVNARSFLYDHVDILDGYNTSDEDFTRWRAQYKIRKLQAHVVKQSLKKERRFLSLVKKYGLTLYKSLVLGVPDIPQVSLPAYVWKKLSNQSQNYTYDQLDITQTRYIFYPMQVSDDTQLLLNSDIDNLRAIQIASDLAKEKGCQLLVKPHPAEKNRVFIRQVYDLKDVLDFQFVNDNTFQLIHHAQEVVTINSTVGLETMILEKPVRFLGRSVFAQFNEQRLKNYIMGYLVDADYFNPGDISETTLEKLLSRACLACSSTKNKSLQYNF